MQTSNFVQIIIQGLRANQQWQVSPCWTVTSLDDTPDAPWVFRQAELITWFDKLWNGGGGVGVSNGLADILIPLMDDQTSITQVKVLARQHPRMAAPVQLVYAASITGTRGVGGTDLLPSFMAASLFAPKDDYGGRGAAMRLPIFVEDDLEGQNWNPGSLASVRATLITALNENAVLAELLVYNPSLDETILVNQMPPCVVNRVSPTGAPVNPEDRVFPYEFPALIQAHTSTGWQIHPWASTQNSRKLGRGR